MWCGRRGLSLGAATGDDVRQNEIDCTGKDRQEHDTDGDPEAILGLANHRGVLRITADTFRPQKIPQPAAKFVGQSAFGPGGGGLGNIGNLVPMLGLCQIMAILYLTNQHTRPRLWAYWRNGHGQRLKREILPRRTGGF